MEEKIALFQVDVSRETGSVTLLIETGCGMRPVMVWPSLNQMKEFAQVLLTISSGSEDGRGGFHSQN
jgi:hypothetical protein